MRTFDRFCAALAALAVLATAHVARADLAVVHVEGSASKRLERDVGKALPDGFESRSSAPVVAAVKAAIRRRPLSKLKEAPSADDSLVKSIQRALRAGKRDVAIVVAIGKSREVRVLVVPLGDDAEPFFRSTTLPHFESAEEHIAWWADLFQEALRHEEPAQAKPEPEPPPEEPKPEPKPEPKEEAPKPAREPESAPAKNERINYFFSLGPDLTLRRFADNEAAAAPRTYRAFPIPGFHVGVDLYPIASGHVGVEGEYGMSIGVQSKASDGQMVPTSFLRASGALKLRLFTAAHEKAPWVALLLGYGYSRFVFDGGPTNREMPTASYQMFRAGLDGRVPVDRVALLLSAEYDRLTSIQPLGATAVKDGGNGVTVRAAVGFEVTPGFELMLQGRYAWLFFSVSRDVPSNVVDWYLTGSLVGELSF